MMSLNMAITLIGASVKWAVLWNSSVFGMLQSYSVLAYHAILFCFNEFLDFAFLFLPLLYQKLNCLMVFIPVFNGFLLNFCPIRRKKIKSSEIKMKLVNSYHAGNIPDSLYKSCV